MKKKVLLVFSPIIGTIIESYNMLLYIHLLPILTPLFFPNESSFSARIISTLTVSATLLMRPLGAIYFGYLGDKRGRKTGLSSSIIFMIWPAFLISILPVYSQISLWAPLILIVCRLLQGFSMGGETGGAHTSLVELSKENYLCTTASFVYVSIILGGLLAAFITYFVNIGFLSWRFAFFIGFLLSGVGFYIRSKMHETSQFIECVKKDDICGFPLRELIRFDKYNLLISFIMSFGAVTPFHLNYVYVPDVLKNILGIASSKINLININTQILTIFLMPIFSILGDKFKKELLMLGALITLLLGVYPLILYNNTYPSKNFSITIQILLSICVSMYAGGFFSSVALMFPANRRFTACGLSISLGVAVFSCISSLFIWGSSRNELFLCTSLFMLLPGILNIVVIHIGSKKGTIKLD